MKKLGYLILNKIPYLIIKYKDGWVAVDEHSGEKGDLAIHKGEVVKVADDNHMLSSYGYKKIIAQSPNLSLEGVMKVEIPEGWENSWEKVNNELPNGVNPHAYRLGFLAAQQRGMFTEEQLDQAFEAGQKWERYQFREIDFAIDLDKFKDSLLPKYEVESFENGETVTKAKLI